VGRILAGRKHCRCRTARSARPGRARFCHADDAPRSMTPQAIVAALRRRFPSLQGAAQGRHLLRHPETGRMRSSNWLEHCGLLVVVGSKSSSNSNRLREPRRPRRRARLPGGWRQRPAARMVFPALKRSASRPGASAPEQLVQEGRRAAARVGAERRRPSLMASPEHVVFLRCRARACGKKERHHES